MHSQVVVYDRLDLAPMIPTWNFVQNTDVISSASTAAFFLLLQKAEINLIARYFVPAFSIFALTEAFLLTYYHKERPYRSNYNFVMDSAANVLSVTTSTVATGLVASSVTAFFPAMATGLIASMIAVGTVRFLSRVTKLAYDVYTDNLENDEDDAEATIPQRSTIEFRSGSRRAKPSIVEGVFRNFYVTAGVSSGIGLACWQNDLFDKVGLGVWLGLNLMAHMALKATPYRFCGLECSGKNPEWSYRSAVTDFAAFGLASFLPLAFTATFASTGAAATIVSGAAAIIAINIGAAVATRILSGCCATLFHVYQAYKDEKISEQISELTARNSIPQTA